MRGNPSIEKNHAYLLIYLHTHNKPDPNYFWPRVPAISHERSSEESAGQKSDDLPAKLFPMINHREGGRGCQKIIIVMNYELFSIYAGSFI